TTCRVVQLSSTLSFQCGNSARSYPGWSSSSSTRSSDNCSWARSPESSVEASPLDGDVVSSPSRSRSTTPTRWSTKSVTTRTPITAVATPPSLEEAFRPFLDIRELQHMFVPCGWGEPAGVCPPVWRIEEGECDEG